MGQADQLYASIQCVGDVGKFVTEQRVEDLHLDFKGALDFSKKEARREFASALSGFANSDGGVIVWGVDARSNEEGVDAACGKRPIERLKAFESDLWRYTAQALNPIPDGVEHRVLEIPGKTDMGYVVTVVPASDSGPHMAKLGEDRYYKRSGNSFLKMEHFEVEDMFGRRPRPKLALYMDPRPAGATLGAHESGECLVVIGLLNTGRGSARAPCLTVKVNEPYKDKLLGDLDTRDRTGFERVRPLGPQVAGEARFAADTSVVIHPGSRRDVTAVRRSLPTDGSSPPDLHVEYEIAAWGVRPEKGQRTVRGDDIRACAFEALRRSMG